MIAKERLEGRSICLAKFSSHVLSFALDVAQDCTAGVYIRAAGTSKFKFWADFTPEERMERREASQRLRDERPPMSREEDIPE